MTFEIIEIEPLIHPDDKRFLINTYGKDVIDWSDEIKDCAIICIMCRGNKGALMDCFDGLIHDNLLLCIYQENALEALKNEIWSKMENLIIEEIES